MSLPRRLLCPEMPFCDHFDSRCYGAARRIRRSAIETPSPQFLDPGEGGSLNAAMFSIPSLTKIIVLVALVLAIWYGFKLIGHLDRMRKQEAKLHGRSAARAGRGTQPAAAVEDMVKCRVCGAYVAKRGAAPCERSDCLI